MWLSHDPLTLLHSSLPLFLLQDIVIFTNDASRCPYYQSESQNIKSRFACVLPPNFLTREKIRSDDPIIPNTQEECEVGECYTSVQLHAADLFLSVDNNALSYRGSHKR